MPHPTQPTPPMSSDTPANTNTISKPQLCVRTAQHMIFLTTAAAAASPAAHAETCLSGFHERIQHHTHELVPAPAPGPGPGLTGYGTERGRFALRPGLYTGKARHVHLEDPRPA
ncbi:hypothetical protein CBS147325_1276 [Penicillium roqueforti]|nr:hypothetical protein CBS147325_1276 [Penicillium roqueforti]